MGNMITVWGIGSQIRNLSNLGLTKFLLQILHVLVQVPKLLGLAQPEQVHAQKHKHNKLERKVLVVKIHKPDPINNRSMV